MDAESAWNTITNNTFDISTGREQIAIDGSAHNKIIANTFRQPKKGGIYLYRNCGEGGTVRHQAPSNNIIIDNIFSRTDLSQGARLIWENSRRGNRRYCHEDDGYMFGSSLDNDDNGVNNTIQEFNLKYSQKNRQKQAEN